MCKNFRDIIPQKIINATSLEDFGWNSCCQKMEDNFKFLAQLHGESGVIDGEYIFSDHISTVN